LTAERVRPFGARHPIGLFHRHRLSADPCVVAAVSKVLVIDDDPAVRQLVCDVLEAYGYVPSAAEDGYAGLRAIAADRPDCVVLDVMMPGLDGHEVLARIRSSEGGSTLPVVMLTAAADDDHAWQAWTEGVDYFIAKPFEPDELLSYLSYLSAA
jgi:DNA-binding response OmpR family regulator